MLPPKHKWGHSLSKDKDSDRSVSSSVGAESQIHSSACALLWNDFAFLHEALLLSLLWNKSTVTGWNKENSSLTIKARLLSKLGTTTFSFLAWPGCRHFEFLPNVLYSYLYHTPVILIRKQTLGSVLWNSEDPLDNTSHACEKIDAH